MNLRWTRLLTIMLTTLLLLAAAGPAAQTVWAIEDEPPQEVLPSSWSWMSDVQGAQAGASVAGAGDVNRDGYADVIVGAPLYSSEIYRSGAAFLFRGSAFGLESTPHWTAAGESQGNAFGTAVASAGDVNCDGYADVIVGAPNYGQNHGRVYVYYGSSSGLSTTPNWTYTSLERDYWLGWSVAGAGNVNGDSHNGKSCDDLLVGVRYFSDGQDREGGVFLFYGSPTGLNSSPDWIGQVNQAAAQFSYAISGAGDVNQDGYDDVLVGAPNYQNDEIKEGAIFLFYGSALGLSSTPAWYATSGLAEARLGYSVSGAGDANGDGYPDLAAGAPGWEGSLGAVFVYHGSSLGPSLEPDWMHAGDTPFIGYGEAVAGAGNLNGDFHPNTKIGYDDLVVGVRKYTNDKREQGAIFVHHGGPAGLAEFPGWRAVGNKAETGFGAWVAAAGNINRDGYSDILVGAPEYKDSQENKRGAAFVYHGFLQEVVNGEIQPRQHYLFLPITTH